MKFEITKQLDKNLARRGRLTTKRSVIETPIFMPCATVGSVKGISQEELADLGYKMILGNTYHLYLRPGDEHIKKQGGLQKYINWPHSMLTDSGGYQVFSLGHNFKKYENDETDKNNRGLVKITKDGVTFRSHLDGSRHKFTPEKVIDIQKNLGSDIMMVLDVCTEHPADKERARETMELTQAWAKRASDYWAKNKNPNQALFGIVQGSTYQDLREESAKFISSLPFDGIAVGGVSVGEGKKSMYEVMKWVSPHLPKDKPHYLMGIGEPEDILEAVKWGFDMFDCVLPTRLGRHGTVWVTKNYKKFEKMDLRKSKFESDKKPIMTGCKCSACSGGYTRSYLHHLLREKEMLGLRLASLHNLTILSTLMEKIRAEL